MNEPYVMPPVTGFVPRTELQAAVDAALGSIRSRPYSQRHPELGKMVNCQVCSTRHRANERKCEQVFTFRQGDYELYREGEKGELVPAYRTAIQPDQNPTKRQVAGAAAFHKKRIKPHPSKIKLQFIERTREIFQVVIAAAGETMESVEKMDKEVFEKHLQRARVLAAREIRKERKFRTRANRRQEDTSRRINKGLL